MTNLPKKIESNDPYTEIADIIKEWCEKNCWCDFVVTIAINGEELTDFLSFDAAEMDFIWEVDWWEGEKDVQLLGFLPIDNIRIYGYPPNDRIGFYVQGSGVAIT